MHIYQLAAPGLAADFPPVRTLDTEHHNLPVQLNSFIGRERELRRVCQALGHARLVTLTGIGGSGKSRLALRAAEDLVSAYDDGVWLVELAAVQNPDAVPAAVLEALGVRQDNGRAAQEKLTEELQHARLLLLLDNYEHLMEAAPLVTELLAAAPRLEILVTSRERLRLREEREFQVLPLAVPWIDANTGDNEPEAIGNVSSVKLFVERAVAKSPGFRLDESNHRAIAEICARLDGLPLAIELAAARVRLFSPPVMLELLDQRLKWLTSGPRDLPARQRTLRDTLDWSYHLLDSNEQALFRCSSVFSGGWTLDSAAYVWEREGRQPVVDVLESLLDKSLIKSSDELERETRFAMLETVREYALGQLSEDHDAFNTRKRHAEYFLTIVEEADRHLRGPEQQSWLRRIDLEHDNIRAALTWALDNDPAQIGLRLIGGLRWYWTMRSHVNEANRWARQMIDAAGRDQQDAVLAKALWCAGVMAWLRQDPDDRAWLEESVSVWRKLDDTIGLAYSLQHLGLAASYDGDYDVAISCEKESIELFRAASAQHGIALGMASLGYIALVLEQRDIYEPMLQESAELARQIGDYWTLALALGSLARAARIRRDYAEVRMHAAEAIEICSVMGTKHEIARMLSDLAVWRYDLGDHFQAAVLFGTSDRLADESGNAYARGVSAEFLTALKEQIGEDRARSLFRKGRSMTLDQVISYVRQAAMTSDEYPHGDQTSPVN
jgi:non-specific serine/threonine protein kinase